MTLDTSRFINGAHTIRVEVVDAAGNVGTVYGPASITVENGSTSAVRGPLNGENASDAARMKVALSGSRGSHVTTSFGRRLLVQGRLTNEDDHGIGNARVEVVERIVGRKSERTFVTRTRQDGSVRLTLPRTASSRTLRLFYRSHVGDANATASATLSLLVRAGLSLAATPRAVHNGDSVTFRGRLLGRPLPRRGKLVEVQVRFPSGWRTFATVRTGRNGVFRYRYTFRRTLKPTTYQFRVRARQETGYPYETGTSHAVQVRVT
jgi:hypothetical protein